MNCYSCDEKPLRSHRRSACASFQEPTLSWKASEDRCWEDAFWLTWALPIARVTLQSLLPALGGEVRSDSIAYLRRSSKVAVVLPAEIKVVQAVFQLLPRHCGQHPLSSAARETFAVVHLAVTLMNKTGAASEDVKEDTRTDAACHFFTSHCVFYSTRTSFSKPRSDSRLGTGKVSRGFTLGGRN